MLFSMPHNYSHRFIFLQIFGKKHAHMLLRITCFLQTAAFVNTSISCHIARCSSKVDGDKQDTQKPHGESVTVKGCWTDMSKQNFLQIKQNLTFIVLTEWLYCIKYIKKTHNTCAHVICPVQTHHRTKQRHRSQNTLLWLAQREDVIKVRLCLFTCIIQQWDTF